MFAFGTYGVRTDSLVRDSMISEISHPLQVMAGDEVEFNPYAYFLHT